MLLELVNALPNVHDPPTPLNVIAPDIVVPFVVIVLPVDVELNVTAPVVLQVVPASKDMEPEIANVGVVPWAKVTDPADTDKSRQVNAPVQVIVYVPAWSKYTSFDDVGTDAPLAPPEDDDQLVVEDVFHVPDPPTQNLAESGIRANAKAVVSALILKVAVLEVVVPIESLGSSTIKIAAAPKISPPSSTLVVVDAGAVNALDPTPVSVEKKLIT
jgi:hypothetical protein